jgi:uncharacterized membrane protein YcfT
LKLPLSAEKGFFMSIAVGGSGSFGKRRGISRPAEPSMLWDYPAGLSATARVDWVDYAKGWCIVLVVMMHAVGGVAALLPEHGWIQHVVAFAKPFRMPDFFLIAGLFLARSIHAPWQKFLDSKLWHFVYLYVLWLGIQLGIKEGTVLLSDPLTFVQTALMALINPLGTLWFVHILPVFFILTKLAMSWRVPPVLLLGGAALAEILYRVVCEMLGVGNPAMMIGAQELTGWVVLDETFQRYVFFVAGFLLAPTIFKLAEFAISNKPLTLALLGGWAVLNAIMVYTPASVMFGNGSHSSLAALPVISLLLGSVVSALLSTQRWSDWLRFIGSQSLIVYLAFFLPSAITRMVLVKFAPELGLSLISLAVTAAGVVVPLVLYHFAKGRGGEMLFKRPDFLKRLTRPQKAAEAHS